MRGGLLWGKLREATFVIFLYEQGSLDVLMILIAQNIGGFNILAWKIYVCIYFIKDYLDFVLIFCSLTIYA